MAACIFFFFALNFVDGLRLVNLQRAHLLKPIVIVQLSSKEQSAMNASASIQDRKALLNLKRSPMNGSISTEDSKVISKKGKKQQNKIDEINIEDEIKKDEIEIDKISGTTGAYKNKIPKKKVNEKDDDKIEDKINEKKVKKAKPEIKSTDKGTILMGDKKNNEKKVKAKPEIKLIDKGTISTDNKKNNGKNDQKNNEVMGYSALSVSNSTVTKESAIVELMVDYPLASGLCAIAFVFCCVCMCCLCLRKLYS